MNKKRALLVGSLLWILPSIIQAEPTSGFKNIREALSAYRTAKTSGEVSLSLEAILRIPLQGHDDLMALYDEAKRSEENIPDTADKITVINAQRLSMAITSRIRECTAPSRQDDIATLLSREYSSLEHQNHRAPTTSIEVVRAELQHQRMKALMDAVAASKNAKARDDLWKVIQLEQDANSGQLAALTLGKIGNSEDLARLLGMIKGNPNLRLSLSGFGAMVAPRLVKEITAAGTAPAIKARLSMELREASTHENLSTYLPLLKDKDLSVAQAASEAIDKSLNETDGDIIAAKFNSQSAYDRAGVIIAVGNHAWNERYIPLLVNVLQHDANADNRELAAKYLGLRKARSAVPALQDASTKDKAARVRLAASVAIERIGKAQ